MGVPEVSASHCFSVSLGREKRSRGGGLSCIDLDP